LKPTQALPLKHAQAEGCGGLVGPSSPSTRRSTLPTGAVARGQTVPAAGRQGLEGLAFVRAYDPCLSCSTHALGMVPVKLSLVGPGGELLDEKATD